MLHMQISQCKVIDNALTLIGYNSKGVQIGEVETPPASDFPLIKWTLHLTYGNRYRSSYRYTDILQQIDPNSPMAIAFAPEHATSRDMCAWIGAAALLGFDVLPFGNDKAKPNIVIIHFDDYNHAQLPDALQLLDENGIKVPYAPPIYDNDEPSRDASGGSLIIGHKNAEWPNAKVPRAIQHSVRKRTKIPRVRFTGEVCGPLQKYFSGKTTQAIHDGITLQVEKMVRSKGPYKRVEKPTPQEFIEALSLGQASLDLPPAQKWTIPRGAEHVEQVLADTDIVIRSEKEVEDRINEMAATLDDYIRIWEGFCGSYCMTPKLEDFTPKQIDKLNAVAEFTGAASAIKAYALGVAIDDILA
jgi:hypothetical protein